MFGKGLFFLILVAGGAVLPYLLSDDKWLNRIEEMFGQVESVADSPGPDAADGTTLPTKVTTAGKVVQPNSATQSASPYGPVKIGFEPTSRSTIGTNVEPSSASLGTDVPLPILLSFEVTPDWITQNWERVTTRLGELDLQGWRVPYSKNARADDFAGSITYYFDRTRKVQRIVLHGYTSNANEILQLATSHYLMQRVPDAEADLYVAVVEQRPIGALQLTYAPLLNSRTKGKRCELLMELNRKGTEYGMSYEFRRLIRASQEANVLLTPIAPSPF